MDETQATARANESEELIVFLRNRAVGLNVEVRLRDVRIAELEAEIAGDAAKAST